MQSCNKSYKLWWVLDSGICFIFFSTLKWNLCCRKRNLAGVAYALYALWWLMPFTVLITFDLVKFVVYIITNIRVPVFDLASPMSSFCFCRWERNWQTSFMRFSPRTTTIRPRWVATDLQWDSDERHLHVAVAAYKGACLISYLISCLCNWVLSDRLITSPEENNDFWCMDGTNVAFLVDKSTLKRKLTHEIQPDFW